MRGMVAEHRKAWRDRAACIGEDPEIFFHDVGPGALKNPGPRAEAAWLKAKRICWRCPVMEECARANLGEIEGVWGGLDPAQRNTLRRLRSQNVRALRGARKLEVARMAWELRQTMSAPDAARVMGVSPTTMLHLQEVYEEQLGGSVETEVPQVAEVEPAEPAVRTFPDRAPREGDGWIWHDRRVVNAHYLGQTADDEWLYMRAHFHGQASDGWYKASDVKLTREVARNVRERAGEWSRIYGTRASRRLEPQAG